MSNTTPKTLEQAVSEFKSGKLCAIAEYRSSKADRIKWRDKETQRVMTGVTLTHAVEFNGTTAMVNERVDEGTFDERAYVSPYVRGSSVLVNIDLVTKTKGITTIYGTLDPIEANGTVTPAPVTTAPKPPAK